MVRDSLADAQPGGRVRLGDQTALQRLHAHLTAYPPPCNPEDVHVLGAALSAQPSTGGQDVREQFETWLETLRLDRSRHGDGYVWNDVELAWRAVEKFSARQPVRIYGCCAQPEGELHTAECPNMRHLAARQLVGEPVAYMVRWKTAGDFGLEWPKNMQYFRDRADEYEIVPLCAAPTAQAVDLERVRQLIGDLRTLDVKESTKNDNAGFVDLRCYWALLGVAGEVERSMADSQAVGNG